MTRSQFTSISSPYFRSEDEEDVGGPVTTYITEKEKEKQKQEKNSPAKDMSRALVIAGPGMRRKHSYYHDTATTTPLEDIAEVDSVLEKESVHNQSSSFCADETEETLVEIDGLLFKEKEVDIEVSDSGEDDADADSAPLSDAEERGGGGVRRRRTVRVVIRSRAFV